VIGRLLMGVGQALSMVAGLTAILRFQAGKNLAFDIAALIPIGMLADRQRAARVLPASC